MDSRRPGIAMFSTHGYVAAKPPLGAADTGGQVVYVLELSKQLAQLGFDVDIWTRRFEDQPEIDLVDRHVRVIRVPCGGNKFIPKEHLYQSLPEWCENALKYIQRHKLAYQFINSHYWDGGVAGQTRKSGRSRLSLISKSGFGRNPNSIGNVRSSSPQLLLNST